MPGFIRRAGDERSLEEERDALRRQREAAAEELERLKRELTERVAAVRDKERALDEALRRAGASPASTGGRAVGDGELPRREADLAAGEQALGTLPAQALPAPAQAAADEQPAPDRLAHIEARLAELREAERVFLRTQEELAARSEALAARERLVAERERELDDLEDRAGLGPTRSELLELETRLRRLESGATAPSLEETQSFAAGLEGLRRRGTRRPPAG